MDGPRARTFYIGHETHEARWSTRESGGAWVEFQAPLHLAGAWAPAWVVSVILGSYPAWTFVRRGARRRRFRRKHGLCLGCGYNLTGNVSGVCPECGTEIKTA